MKDLTNKKFNRFTCLKPAGKTRARLIIWECICDCGKIKHISSDKLRKGSTKSCGCLKNENLKNNGGRNSKRWKGYEDLSLSVFSRLKGGAKLRGHSFELSMEYLWKLFEKQKMKCALSNQRIYMPVHSRPNDNRLDKKDFMASLDRVDNNLGYIEGNVRWVCKELNYMKHTMTDKSFLSFIKQVYEHNNLNLSN